MAFSFANLKWQRLLAAAAAMTVLPSGGQTTMRRGQPILFSSPDNNSISTNVPSLTPKAPDFSTYSGAAAPTFNPDAAPPAEPPPAPVAPVMSPAAVERLQTLLDKRQNWTLLTPAEILDVPTPEKILGIPEYGADGLPKRQSVVERYYERQQRQQTAGTNAVAGSGSWQTSDFFGSQTSRWTSPWGAGLLSPPDNSQANPAAMSQFLSGGAANKAGFNQASDDGWPKLFSPPAPQTPGPNAAQPSAMDQFQQLLAPPSPPPAAARTSTGANTFSRSPTTPDSIFGKSPLSPLMVVGTPMSPMSGTVGAPLGVAPLPGILGPTNPAATVIIPNWKPELPPWMSQGPQPGVIPQRKF